MPLGAGEMLLSSAVRSHVLATLRHTKAMATGTIGHRMFTHDEMTLLLLKQIFKNLNGCMPFLPLSPSG